MLVLSRKRDEKLIFTTATGERIEVQVVEIRGDKVRLGCCAADSVTIDREEVDDAKRRDGVKKWKPLDSQAVSKQTNPQPRTDNARGDL